MIHYPFSKYLQSVYCVLGIVLDTEDKAVNKVLALSLCSSVGKQQYTDTDTVMINRKALRRIM